MPFEPPPCPLCKGTLARDMCGPIEGGIVWVRKGDTRPSEEVEGAEGERHWVCQRCLGPKTP